MNIRATLFFLVLSGFAACAATPLQDWQAMIAEQNKAYSRTPHAMLKIQDAAYVEEGQTAVLTGKPGDPASWRWSPDAKAQGPLRIALKQGNLSVSLNGKPATGIEKSIAITPDIDVRGEPTQVGAGVNGWRLFVYNQKHPAALNFKTVSYYPFDPAFRVTARFIPDAKLPPVVFMTSRGTEKQFFHGGDAVFTVKGQQVRLPFYAESNKPREIHDLSAFYTDALTGKGAYGSGRYVDVMSFGKFPPATVVIDFNQAYNPNCARSDFFTCPLAVDKIPLAMAAGERDPHAH